MYVKCECGKIVSSERKSCWYCGKLTQKGIYEQLYQKCAELIYLELLKPLGW